MSDLQQQLDALDAMTGKGDILPALDMYYADDCVFTEAADRSARNNKQAQHEHLSGFFASLSGFNSATLHGSAAGDNVTYSEWTFDMTAGDGSAIVWNEVLVRRWSHGKVIAETFYNVSG